VPYYNFKNDATASIMTREIVICDADSKETAIGWIAKVGDCMPSIIHENEIDALRHAVLMYIDEQKIPVHRL